MHPRRRPLLRLAPVVALVAAVGLAVGVGVGSSVTGLARLADPTTFALDAATGALSASGHDVTGGAIDAVVAARGQAAAVHVGRSSLVRPHLRRIEPPVALTAGPALVAAAAALGAAMVLGDRRRAAAATTELPARAPPTRR